MKKILFLFISLIITVANAQNYSRRHLKTKDSLQLVKALDTYFDMSINQNWDGVLDRIYPGIFTITPRDQMKKILINATGNQSMRLIFRKPEHIRIDPEILEKDGKKYVLIDYVQNFTLVFYPRNKENKAAFEGRMKYTLYDLKKKYGEENVHPGSNDNIFHLSLPKHMLAVYLPDKQQYFFIDFGTQTPKAMMLQSLFDDELLKYFNEKIQSEQNP